MLKLVPFNHAWINHEKLDLKGIYRRPRFTVDEWGERLREYGPDGLPTWDIVGPLPIKQHNAFMKKGFEFVTLANRESLYTAAKFGTLPDGAHVKEFDQHATGGPWNARQYHETAKQHDLSAAQQLQDDVARFGAEAVEAIRRQTDPAFTLPPALRKPKAAKGAA